MTILNPHKLDMNKIIVSLLLTLISVTAGAAGTADTQTEKSGWDYFVWGAEVGGAIDMTSNDMSTLNLDAFFGYKNSWINVLGVGASVNMMVSNSVRCFPVYAMFRTNFTSTPSLLFMDLRSGVVINNLSYGDQQTSFYCAPGLGVNLARGRTFQSYVVLSYVYNGMKSFEKKGEPCRINGLSMACLRIGISF